MPKYLVPVYFKVKATDYDEAVDKVAQTINEGAVETAHNGGPVAGVKDWNFSIYALQLS